MGDSFVLEETVARIQRILGRAISTYRCLFKVHRPPRISSIMKTTREAANIALAGSAIGAVSTAGLAWKYSRSLHGAGLAFLGGGVFGWTFGQEIANHWYQLYRLDTMAAQVKFIEWWEKKCQSQRRS